MLMSLETFAFAIAQRGGEAGGFGAQMSYPFAFSSFSVGGVIPAARIRPSIAATVSGDGLKLPDAVPAGDGQWRPCVGGRGRVVSWCVLGSPAPSGSFRP